MLQPVPESARAERPDGLALSGFAPLRGLPLRKAPGVAESLDWALALMSLHRDHLDARALEQTLGCVLKVHEDHAVMNAHHAALEPILEGAPGGLESAGPSREADFGFGSVSTPRR